MYRFHGHPQEQLKICKIFRDKMSLYPLKTQDTQPLPRTLTSLHQGHTVHGLGCETLSSPQRTEDCPLWSGGTEGPSPFPRPPCARKPTVILKGSAADVPWHTKTYSPFLLLQPLAVHMLVQCKGSMFTDTPEGDLTSVSSQTHILLKQFLPIILNLILLTNKTNAHSFCS